MYRMGHNGKGSVISFSFKSSEALFESSLSNVP